MAVSYEKAGVNLEAGYEVVRRIKSHVASTSRLGVMGNIGSFGGMFDLSALNVKEPVLVSGTDGVGTKLKIAFAMDKHDTIGIDAVAMCVNDVLAQGAEPLFFLDYVAVGHNEPEKIEAIVAGVAEGCRQAGCALVGGETAEMPGMYPDGEYDIAGFTTGVVEKSALIDGSKVKSGDVLVGIASSGIHSNGFSLVRKIFSDNGLDLHASYPELDGQVLGEVALKDDGLVHAARGERLDVDLLRDRAHRRVGRLDVAALDRLDALDLAQRLHVVVGEAERRLDAQVEKPLVVEEGVGGVSQVNAGSAQAREHRHAERGDSGERDKALEAPAHRAQDVSREGAM